MYFGDVRLIAPLDDDLAPFGRWFVVVSDSDDRLTAPCLDPDHLVTIAVATVDTSSHCLIDPA